MSIRTVGVGKQYSTIQSALDNLYAVVGGANFTETHTIEVYNGTYTETITPNGSLKPTATFRLIITVATGNIAIIDGTYARARAILILIHYLTLSNFSITRHTASQVVPNNAVNGNIISGNKVYEGLSTGIAMVEGGTDLIIENNEVYQNASIGIEIAKTTPNAIIRNNKVYQNAGTGIYINGTLGTSPSNTLVYNNIVYMNTIGIYLSSVAGWGVYNNTLYENSGHSITVIGATSTNGTLKNNIVYKTIKPSIYCIRFDNVSQVGMIFNKNNWFTVQYSELGFWTSSRRRLSDWQTATGQDTDSISVNPDFVDVNLERANNFAIKSTSPCVGIGENLSAIFTTDYNGATRTTWDLGAVNNVVYNVPAISNIALDNTAITTSGTVLITLTVSGSPVVVGVRINNIDYEATGSGTTYTVSISGSSIGVITSAVVIGYAVNLYGGIEYIASSTITVSATAYTNYYNTLLTDLQALLQAEFTDNAVLIGDRAVIQNYPCIILEPYDKNIDGDISSGKKDFAFLVYIWVYHTQNEDAQSVSMLTNTCERIEELLMDYRENPIQNGSKWYISSPGKIKYGTIRKSSEILRTAQMEWNFKKRVNRN